jgi:hypothetical protein
MIVIRGKVEPEHTAETNGGLRSFFGKRRWNLEYVVKDGDGNKVDEGRFKARRDGCFAVALDARAPGAVEIRLKGGAAYKDDCCTIRVFSENDVINLPRKLNPN